MGGYGFVAERLLSSAGRSKSGRINDTKREGTDGLLETYDAKRRSIQRKEVLVKDMLDRVRTRDLIGDEERDGEKEEQSERQRDKKRHASKDPGVDMSVDELQKQMAELKC